MASSHGRSPFRSPLALLALVGLALLAIPLASLLIRVSWTTLGPDLRTAGAKDAIWLSLRTTLTTVVLCLLLGTPLAWILARSEGRWVPWVRAIVTVPLVLPPVVGGLALLVAWGKRGVIGGPVFDLTGWQLPYNWSRVVLAEVFVALPFFVLAVEGAMRSLDPRYDDIASTLGATPTRTFSRVVIPQVLPGIAAGAMLAWARALGEFGATLTFAGSFPGTTMTAPLAIYQALDVDQNAANALAIVMLLVCVLVLGALRGKWLR